MAEALNEVHASLQRNLDEKEATVFRVKGRGPV
jgi:hypothetical protein